MISIARIQRSSSPEYTIGEENGGKEERVKDSSNCLIYVDSTTENNKIWDVSYITITTPGFDMHVDMETGEYEVISSGQ